jgi:hypothetical protein
VAAASEREKRRNARTCMTGETWGRVHRRTEHGYFSHQPCGDDIYDEFNALEPVRFMADRHVERRQSGDGGNDERTSGASASARTSSLRLLNPKRNAGEYISALHYMLFFMPPCGCTAPIASAPAVSSPAAFRPRHRARTQRHRRRSSRSTGALHRTTSPCPGHRCRSSTCCSSLSL